MLFCVYYFPLSLPSSHLQSAYHSYIDAPGMGCLREQRIRGGMGLLCYPEVHSKQENCL